MQMHSSKSIVRGLAVLIVAALLPVSLLVTPSGAASSPTVTPIVLSAPGNLPGVPALPGPVANAFTPASSLGVLGVTPNQGVEGTPITITGTGLPANASVNLDWSTSNATWVADVEPNTVNYLGTSYSSENVVLATVTTNSSGSFTYATKAPDDFGGTHTIYAVVNNVEDAYGGFELLRILSVSPRSGPVGTPITITYTSMGASLYTGGASVIYDNHYVGEMMANWTRGTASITIPATGSVGEHFIQVGNAISYMYLNVIQSPIPYTNGGTATFTVTSNSALVAPKITWPASVTPTVSQVTTLSTTGLDPSSTAVATLSQTSGPVNTNVTLKVTGLSGSGTDQLNWSTVVGNRVNCTSTCWAYLLGSTRISDDRQRRHHGQHSSSEWSGRMACRPSPQRQYHRSAGSVLRQREHRSLYELLGSGREPGRRDRERCGHVGRARGGSVGHRDVHVPRESRVHDFH